MTADSRPLQIPFGGRLSAVGGHVYLDLQIKIL
jgi:hypothetical protein